MKPILVEDPWEFMTFIISSFSNCRISHWNIFCCAILTSRVMINILIKLPLSSKNTLSEKYFSWEHQHSAIPVFASLVSIYGRYIHNSYEHTTKITILNHFKIFQKLIHIPRRNVSMNIIWLPIFIFTLLWLLAPFNVLLN